MAALQEVDQHIHVACFTRAVAVEIRRKLLAAGHAAQTLSGKRYLIEAAAVIDAAIANAPCEDRVEVYGRRGFLRLVASQAGQEELLRVESDLQRGSV